MKTEQEKTEKVAGDVRSAVQTLNLMLERAWQEGLRVELEVVENHTIGSRDACIMVDAHIYKAV